MRRFIGVDLGATWVRAALADEGLRFLAREKERTDVSSEENLQRQLVRIVSKLLTETGTDGVEAVGLASVGPLNLDEGSVENSPNIPLTRVRLVEPLSEALRTEVYLINDCTAACLGEWLLGSGRGLKNVVYVAFGTGIGGGAVSGGELLLGEDGNAMEVGHMVVDPTGLMECGCGGRGHWEAYCSGAGMPRFFRKWADRLGLAVEWVEEADSKTILSKARLGDRAALRFLGEVQTFNAYAMANLTNLLNPALISVGGAVALNNKDLIVEPLRRSLPKTAFCRPPKVEACRLGEDAPLVGAVLYAMGGGSTRPRLA